MRGRPLTTGRALRSWRGPTHPPRADKYKSKAFIDTFVYRGGDVVGAQVEGVLGRLGMGLAALISVSVPLAIVWGALGVWLGRQQQWRAVQRPQPAGAKRQEWRGSPEATLRPGRRSAAGTVSTLVAGLGRRHR